MDDGDATIVTKHERPRMATITLMVTIPVDMSGAPRGAEPVLGGFFRIVDPSSEAAVGEINAAGMGIVRQ